jgi:hypothetical protein
MREPFHQVFRHTTFLSPRNDFYMSDCAHFDFVNRGDLVVQRNRVANENGLQKSDAIIAQ